MFGKVLGQLRRRVESRHRGGGPGGWAGRWTATARHVDTDEEEEEFLGGFLSECVFREDAREFPEPGNCGHRM